MTKTTCILQNIILNVSLIINLTSLYVITNDLLLYLLCQVNLEDIICDNDDFNVNDPFLNALFFDNDDEDELDGSSVEDWSGSKQD